jgi:glutaredoxin
MEFWNSVHKIVHTNLRFWRKLSELLTVIGTENCSKCMMTKVKLDKKNIEYKYRYYSDLSNREQDSIDALARKCNIMSFPIVLDEDFNIVDVNNL